MSEHDEENGQPGTVAENVEGLEIETVEWPDATVGAEYTVSVSAKGGKEPYLFGFSPIEQNGLKGHPNGKITGTPTTPGLVTFAVAVQDAHVPEKHASRTLNITIVG